MNDLMNIYFTYMMCTCVRSSYVRLPKRILCTTLQYKCRVIKRFSDYVCIEHKGLLPNFHCMCIFWYTLIHTYECISRAVLILSVHTKGMGRKSAKIWPIVNSNKELIKSRNLIMQKLIEISFRAKIGMIIEWNWRAFFSFLSFFQFR